MMGMIVCSKAKSLSAASASQKRAEKTATDNSVTAHTVSNRSQRFLEVISTFNPNTGGTGGHRVQHLRRGLSLTSTPLDLVR
jgi:hypothetical protein